VIWSSADEQITESSQGYKMFSDTVTALLYLMAGTAIIYLFKERRKKLSDFSHDHLPEISKEDFSHLIILLKTAYERMLYLGVLFLPLAFSAYRGGEQVSSIFFLLLIILIFFSNIGPRNKIMRLLEENGVSIADLQQKGINL